MLPYKMSFNHFLRVCNMLYSLGVILDKGAKYAQSCGWKNSAVKNSPSGSASFDSWQFSTAPGKTGK